MRAVDLATASILILLGGVVVADSLRIGIGWGTDGPRSGFFPFWLGVIMILACAAICVQAWRRSTDKPFVTRERLAPVLKVLWPATLMVILITPLGLYVASALYMAFYMRWVGRHGWLRRGPLRDRHSAARVRGVRDLVPGSDAQGPARGVARILTDGRREPPPRISDRDHAVQPRRRGARHHARHHHRRPARARGRQRRRDPAAPHLHDAPHLRDHPADVALLGRALRRRDHVGALQHPGRAVVGGDDLRRLPHGAGRARPARRSRQPSPRHSSAPCSRSS